MRYTTQAHEVYPGVLISDIEYVRTNRIEGIDRVVTVCPESVSDNIIEGVVYRQFPLADGHNARRGEMDYGVFSAAADAVATGIYRDETTLVHCMAGVSRAPSVTGAAIGAQTRVPFERILSRIKDVREFVNPDPDLRGYARRYVNRAVGEGGDEAGGDGRER